MEPQPSTHLEKFGKYEIIRKLSRSMTDVYLARDSWTNRKIVLKKIEHSRDDFTRLAIDAETRGAEIQHQLHGIDPRILEVYERGEQNNCFFVAMEYFEGKNIAEILKEERRLDPQRAARYAVEICSQLRTLHSYVADVNGQQRTFVHGDIKPSNIQIGLKDDLKLLDFGISKTISSTHNLTRHNMGSPSYCSPERLSRGQVDFHVDLWAVGVTLFEMLAGTPPYQAQDTRQLENIIQSKRPPRALPDDCPAPLKGIVLKALAGDIDLRFRSAQEFENDLRAYLANQPVAAAVENPAWDSNATVDKNAEPVVANTNPTVRMERPSHSAAATRRTQPAQSVRPVPPGPVRASVYNPGRSRWTRPGLNNLIFALLTGLVAGLLVIVPFFYSFGVFNESSPLRGKRDYAHDSIKLVDADWELYQGLRSRTRFLGSFSPVGFADHAFRNNLIDAADNIIDGYRNSAMTRASDFDWSRARKCLRYALQIDSSDTKVKGKLALCEGYLNLIQYPRPPKASLSIDSFRQAASYLPHMPDPHLGLARLYVYAFHNIGEADAEFQQAEQLGFKLGPREMAQKADGYMYRSEFELGRARRAAPKNKDEAAKWLQMARTDIESARHIYEPLVGFANVSANLEQVYQDRSEEIRLEEASLQPQPNLGNQ